MRQEVINREIEEEKGGQKNTKGLVKWRISFTEKKQPTATRRDPKDNPSTPRLREAWGRDEG